MISFDEAKTIMKRLAQDESTEGVSFLVTMMNIGYKEVLADLRRTVTEKSATANLVSDQRSYQMPPDLVRIKNMYVLDGETKYAVIEEPSKRWWTLMTQNDVTGLPRRYHYRPNLGVGGGVVELEPKPSSSTYDLIIDYEATARDLGNDKYEAGTISVTNHSATVTGSGTTFTAAMVGRYLKVTDAAADNLYYKIASYNSATEIVLENVYEGSTQTGVSYEIVESFELPEELHMLPIHYAAWAWWSSKKDSTRARQFENMFDKGIKQARRRYSSVTGDTGVHNDVPNLPFGDGLPEYFPSEIS